MTVGFFGCFLEGIATVVALYGICRTGRKTNRTRRRVR